MTLDVNNIKVSIAIEGSKLPRDILPAEGAPGSAKAIISLQVKAGDVELTASFKAKSYRDVLNKVDALQYGAYAVLQGKLCAGGVLQDVGFAVQPIVPKEPKTEAPSE